MSAARPRQGVPNAGRLLHRSESALGEISPMVEFAANARDRPSVTFMPTGIFVAKARKSAFGEIYNNCCVPRRPRSTLEGSARRLTAAAAVPRSAAAAGLRAASRLVSHAGKQSKSTGLSAISPSKAASTDSSLPVEIMPMAAPAADTMGEPDIPGTI